MRMEYPQLPGWIFEIDEVSAGVYQVNARDEQGRTIQLTDTEPNYEELLARARASAQEMSKRSSVRG